MGGQQGVSTVDMERTLKSLNGYHEVEVSAFHRFQQRCSFQLII